MTNEKKEAGKVEGDLENLQREAEKITADLQAFTQEIAETFAEIETEHKLIDERQTVLFDNIGKTIEGMISNLKTIETIIVELTKG